jgi:hypothetical protein
MRAFHLCLFLAVGVMAQQKDVSFRNVLGGSFAGFSEDEKAEKIWEATAVVMRPAAEAGVWDMDVIKVQSLRGGKPWATFTSPNGTMTPARRAAQGNGVVQSSSPAFNLTGTGWSWRSTPKGDSFAILADVVAELDLAKPLSKRLRLRAPRMDASPVEGGTLMIFQGNAADAAYDATVIQHEFGHGAVYATANISFDTFALDSRSANNEAGALHEGFADYIAAAYNNLAEVGPYFGPRVTAGQPMTPGVRTDSYLRSMDNTFNCPEVLWGEVHQDGLHIAGALWQGRNQFGTTPQLKERYDAAFYAMLVSIAPNADFTMVASTMAARVGTAFSSNTMAEAQMRQIFTSRGVIGCSKTLTVDGLNFPRPYYGIPSVQGFGNSLIPGPVQFKVALPTGAARIRVTGAAGGGGPWSPTESDVPCPRCV